ncbi:MAG: FAD binding domain-containing protein [Thermoleophilia bacterium]
MKPASFRYAAVETVDEAVALLAEHGDEAKVLAGGQSLVPLMNLRLAEPGLLVDVNRVAGLDGIAANGVVELGATARQADVERSPAVAAAAPLVVRGLQRVAYPTVRARGTIGGSIAHADPAAELPAVLLALGGEVVARGPGGERTIAADDLFRGYFTTALAPDELLVRVRVPAAAPGLRVGLDEVARKQGDFALAGAAVAVEVDEAGTCRSARVAVFGVADRPIRLAAAEQALVGRPLADAAARDEAAAAALALDTRGDGHASAEYRREAAAAMVRRALAQATDGGAR